MASTRSSVGGTTGSPSVQPRSNISSISSIPGAGAAEASASHSEGSTAAFEAHPGLRSGSEAAGVGSSGTPRSSAARPRSTSSADWSQPTIVPRTVASRSTSTTVGTDCSS